MKLISYEAISINYYKLASVSLTWLPGVQIAVVCGLWLYYIFPYYLIKGMLNILAYWAGSLHTIQTNTEELVVASKVIGLEVNV